MSVDSNSPVKVASWPSSSINPWLIWGCAAIFYLYQFIIRVSPSVMADQLMRDLGIQACAMGTLASFCYTGYVSMQVPAGLILDRIGIRKPLALAAILIMSGSFLFASSKDINIMSFGRLLIGVGSAFGFLSCVKSASVWLPPHRLGLAIGLSFMLGTAGAVLGGLPLATLSETIGWSNTMFLLGAVGSLIAFLVYTFVRDRKTNPYVEQKPEDLEPISILNAIRIVLKNPLTYVFGAYGLAMYVPLAGFVDLWGIPYLMQTYGVEKTIAAGTVSLFYIGMGAGAPLSALVADYFVSHKRVLMYSAIGLLVAFAIMVYVPDLPLIALQAIYVIGGVFAGAQFLAFASVCQINPSQIGGCASGIHNMMCMASGVIFQPLIGKLLEVNWNGTMVEGAPLYSVHDYRFALGTVPACLLAAVFLCFFMKETYPRVMKQNA